MITVKDYFKDMTDIDETTLAEFSDSMWAKGNLQDIREQISSDLFALHVLVNLIGNWKCEGWWFLLCEQVELVPSIEDVLKQADANEIRTAYEKVISCFPADTVFEYSDEYFDMVNFLQSMAYKPKSEKLKSISREGRKAMIKQIQEAVDNLDEITEQFWGEACQESGWKQALELINAHR